MRMYVFSCLWLYFVATSNLSAIVKCLHCFSLCSYIVMAKRLPFELFQQYYTTLVYLLPIKDTDFIDGLFRHGLINKDLRIKLESLTEHDERSSYFLDNVIKPALADGSNRCFVSLVTIMNSSKYENVKNLAEKIDKQLAVDIKIQSKMLFFTYANYAYMYICT